MPEREVEFALGQGAAGKALTEEEDDAGLDAIADIFARTDHPTTTAAKPIRTEPPRAGAPLKLRTCLFTTLGGAVRGYCRCRCVSRRDADAACPSRSTFTTCF